MSLVHWTDAESIGIEIIDGQHEALATALNGFHDLVIGGADVDRVDMALTELLGLLREHFGTEANLMAKNAYPPIESHLAEHRAYLERIESMQAAYASSDPSSIAETFFLFRDWFVAHTQKEDAALGVFLQKNQAADSNAS